MTNLILVSARVGETRVAVMEADLVREIHFFRAFTPSLVGNIYLAFVRRPAAEFEGAFIELEPGLNAFLPLKGAPPAEGARILVQVKKDALAGKPAEATSKIRLTSRHLHYRPQGKGLEISAAIGKAQKAEWAAYLQGLEQGKGGIQLRSAAAEATFSTVADELAAARALWAEIERAAAGLTRPHCLYKDPAPVLGFIRDHATAATRVLFDRADILAAARLRLASPEVSFELHKGQDLFADFAVDAAIGSLFETTLPLPKGGTLVIEETEALVAIDVNAGAASHRIAAAELAFHTNMEAAREIARQLRLRQLGGLIVIDFIDMATTAHNRKLLQAFDGYLAEDPRPVSRTGFSAFGLVELTRQKSGPSLPRQLMQPRAPQPTLETSALAALALTEATGHKNPGRALVLEVDAGTARWLLENAALLLAEVESRIAAKITVKPRSDFAPGHPSVYIA